MKLLLLQSAIVTAIFASASAYAAPLTKKVDGEWITLSGKVANVKADSFTLKAGGKDVLVEMDDYGWDADGYKLVNGDQVVVNGRVDKGFLEKPKIEAGSVYVKGINTYFFASSKDEEGDPVFLTTSYSLIPALPEGAHVDIQGKVVAETGREFTVDTGFRKVTVDTGDLVFNPLDKAGYTKIDRGDWVRVSGKIEDGFWTGKKLSAAYVSEI